MPRNDARTPVGKSWLGLEAQERLRMIDRSIDFASPGYGHGYGHGHGHGHHPGRKRRNGVGPTRQDKTRQDKRRESGTKKQQSLRVRATVLFRA